MPTKYIRLANSIEGLITSLNYTVYTPHEVEVLVFLTNYIRRIPAEELAKARIKEATESSYIFEKLKKGYSTRTMHETVKDLLIEYEHYEILIEIDF